MPLTEEQKRQLQARIGQPVVPSVPRPTVPGALPPEIQALVSGLPPAQPTVKYGPSGPTYTPPPSNQQVERELGIEYAKGRMKALTPTVAESIKRDFARIDAFEGILEDMEGLAKSFRKGPVQGTYAKLGAKATGGGKFPGVGQFESENMVTYSDLRPGVAAGLYRAVTGDDRISDVDAAQRAMPFVPDPYLQPGAFNKRLVVIKKAIKRKRASIRKSISLGGTPSLQEGEDSAPLFYSFMTDTLTEDE